MGTVVARLRQQGGSPGQTGRHVLQGQRRTQLFVIRHAGQQGPGRPLPLAAHLLGQQAAIYGHGERLTHPHILQLGAAQVEGIEVGAQQRQTPDPLRCLFHGLLVILQRHLVGELDLTRLVAQPLRVLGSQGQIGHPLDPGVGIIPVLSVALGFDTLVRHPVHQPVGAVADQLARLGPLLAKLGDGPLVDRHEGALADELQEVGYGPLQGYLEDLIALGLHPQGIEIEGTGIDGLGVVDAGRQQETGGGRGLRRAQQTPPGVDEIPRGEWLAVGPLELRTQEEAPHQAILAGLPALGLSRHYPALPILADQPLEQVHQHHLPRETGADLGRVEGLGFGAVALDQGLPVREGRLLHHCGRLQRRRQHQSEQQGREPATGWPGGETVKHDINLVQFTLFQEGEGRRRALKRMHDAALVIPEDAPYCIGLARQMESFGLFFSGDFSQLSATGVQDRLTAPSTRLA
ncbi:hypothetical protein D3C77_135330 [compost metagenome]